MSLLTKDEIEAIYADGKGMEEFARAIERRVLEKQSETIHSFRLAVVEIVDGHYQTERRNRRDPWLPQGPCQCPVCTIYRRT